MGFLLLIPGALFALTFVLNVIFLTRAGNERIGRGGTLLAFLAGVFPLAALIMNNFSAIPLTVVGELARWIAALIVIPCAVIAYVEYRRPDHALAESRGLLGIGVGLFLIFMSFTASTLFPAPPTAPLQEVALETDDMLAPTPTGTPVSEDERARMLFASVMIVIGEQTGLDPEGIVAQFDEDVTVAQMVANGGGDLETLVQDLLGIGVDHIQHALTVGEMSQIEAGLGLSLLEPGVRGFVAGLFGNNEHIITGVLAGNPDATGGAEGVSTPAPD